MDRWTDGWMRLGQVLFEKLLPGGWKNVQMSALLCLANKLKVSSIVYTRKKKQYAPFKIILKRKKKMILFHLF